MSEISSPHDKFFKKSFERRDIASDFLIHYLPSDVAAELDLRAPQLQKDSFVDPVLREHFSDLLYRVRFKRGGAAFVYLLFEHKSTPEELVAYQVLRYEVLAWEPLARAAMRKPGKKKLPPIMPIVIYHGPRPWQVPRNFSGVIEWHGSESFRRFMPEFMYFLLDLSVFSEAQIVGAALLRVCLLVLKHAYEGDLIERLPALLGLLPAREQGALEYLATVLKYVSEVARPLTRNEFEAVKEQLPTETGEIMETWASSMLKEGKQIGRQEGRQEAGAELTLYQLQEQLGALDERTRARVRKLAYEQLLELSGALLKFKSPKDLMDWLRTHARGRSLAS